MCFTPVTSIQSLEHNDISIISQLGHIEGFRTPPSHLVVEVAQAAVALGGSVELSDLRDVEAVHELLPDGLPQAVAQRHAHPVLPLRVPHRLVQQVPADLADVLHDLEERGVGRGAALELRSDLQEV